MASVILLAFYGRCPPVGAINEKQHRYLSVFGYRKLLFLLSALAVLSARAQYDASFSHYFAMEPSFNPATVGKQAKLTVTGAYAMDLVGYEHHPKTMYAAADLPFRFMGAYHGGGIQYLNDQIGLFTHRRLALQYAFQRRLLGGTLGIGLQGGLLNEGFDGTKLQTEDPNDPAFASAQLAGSAFDAGLGLYYTHGAWYAGASVQHLTSPRVELNEKNRLQIDPAYYLTGGYNIRLRNPFLSIKPSVLVRTDGVVYRADVTGRLVYTHETRTVYGGVSYSPTNSLTFLLGGSFHGIILGYSYELYTSAINPGNGSHGLFVSYQTDINIVKKGRNSHKSVRIL